MCDVAAWYVVATEAKAEKRAAEALKRAGLAVYLPMARRWATLRRRHGERRRVECPAFPCYLFIGSAARMDWQAIRDSAGVVGVVCMGAVPVRLRPRDVEDVMAAEDMGAFDFTTETVRLRVGERVMLTVGPFDGYVATVARPPRSARPEAEVVTEIALFGRSTPVVVPLDKIRVLA